MGKKKYDYLEDIKEWQDHQYDPGYYLGGRIPPYIKNPGNRTFLGLAFLVPVIMSALFWTINIALDGRIVVSGFEEHPWLGRFIAFFGSGIIFLLMIIAGVNLIRTPRKKKILHKRRKKQK